MFDEKENFDFFYQSVKNFDTVLDIGAGTGRIAIPLANKNLKVICVEPSPAMRDQILKKLINSPKFTNLIKIISGNAADFRLDEKYPAAILSGCFDHFLTDKERESSLVNINFDIKTRNDK